MKEVYFSIGSNQGDRLAKLNAAVEMLEQRLGKGSLLRRSSVIETKAWGFEAPDFLNCAVCLRSDKQPLEILRICKEIESALGRTPAAPQYDADGKRIYHDRPIDIDILLYGDEKVELPELRIPHPLMRERDFVMLPLKEILKGGELPAE